MSKRNKSGKTWREHAAPHLRRALKSASKSWKPKSQRTNMKKVVSLRAQRERINAAIKKEIDK